MDSLLETAAADGRNNADAAHIEVRRNTDRLLTKAVVCISGSIPHLVWAKFWKKLAEELSDHS
jgi:fructose-1-phosphate kinase PfkB-like protein